mgnify:CR=1 FL=1
MKSKHKIPLIGVDLLGGDNHQGEHLLEVIKGLFNEVVEPFRLLVFATPEITLKIKQFENQNPTLFKENRILSLEVKEVIHMDDEPLLAIRRKKEASICVGMRMLQKKEIDVLVSTGNTGALIASAMMHLPMLEGVTRAALLKILPTKKKPIAVIDVGANIHCKPEHLVQFAKMGLAYQKTQGIENPKVGLLNIGTEEKKGRAELQETYQLLLNFNEKDLDRTFIGNVEGKQVFSGDVQVLVTDGFTGNVFLKTAEGISFFILETLHENQDLPFLKTLLKRIENDLYYAEYPGAILCGVDGIVMKCHGDATPQALINGIKGAINLAHTEFLEKMKSYL